MPRDLESGSNCADSSRQLLDFLWTRSVCLRSMASGAIDTDRGVSIFLDQDFAEDSCPAVQVDHDITLGLSEASPKASVISVPTSVRSNIIFPRVLRNQLPGVAVRKYRGTI